MEQNNLEERIKKIQEEKEKRKERAKDRYKSIKTFSLITSVISNFIGTILLGVLVGYGISVWANNNNWMVIGIIVFFLIAVVSFFIRMARIR